MRFKLCLLAFLFCSAIAPAGFAQPQSNSEVKKKLFKVVREIYGGYKKLSNAKLRNTIAVLDFDEQSQKAKEKRIGFAVSELLATRLARARRDSRFIFRMVERKQLERALEEIALGMTGVIDDETAQEAGRMLGADMIVIGSVSELGNSFNFNVRLLETETGEVLTATVVQFEKASLNRTVERLLSDDYGLYKGIPKYRLFGGYQFNFDANPMPLNIKSPYHSIKFGFHAEIAPFLMCGLQGSLKMAVEGETDHPIPDTLRTEFFGFGADFWALFSLKVILQRDHKFSPFFGVGGGVALIGSENEVSATPSFGGIREYINIEYNGAIEVFYPFVGFVLARKRPLSIGVEVGYLFSPKKIEPEITSYEIDISGLKPIDLDLKPEDVSVTYKRLTASAFLQFYF